MKRILAIALVLLALSCAALAEGQFRVGMECDYAPFNWTQTSPSETAVAIEAGGYADGYDVQIAKRIADGLGKELVIVKTAWDGLPMAVMSGGIDAIIAGMSPTEERKATIDFSDYYYESDLVVVVKKDGAYANAAALSDFTGAAITGQLNTFHYTVIDQIPGVNKLTAMETFPAMIVALNAGAIDGYIAERPGAIANVSTNTNLTYVAFPEGQGFQTAPEDVAISVGLAKGSPLAEEINTILAGISSEERQAIMAQAVENSLISE